MIDDAHAAMKKKKICQETRMLDDDPAATRKTKIGQKTRMIDDVPTAMRKKRIGQETRMSDAVPTARRRTKNERVPATGHMISNGNRIEVEWRACHYFYQDTYITNDGGGSS